MENTVTARQNSRTEFIQVEIKELRVSNAILLGEIEMFEGLVARLDPKELLEVQDQQFQTGSEGLMADGTLTAPQKLHIAQQEVEEAQREREKQKQRFDRIIESRKASMMEADLRQAEIRKARSRLERRLVRFMESSQPERTDAEKLLCCIQDGSKVTRLERLSQENAALRLKAKNLLQQIKQEKQKQENADMEADFLDQEGAGEQEHISEMRRKCRDQQNICSHTEKLRRWTAESSQLDADLLRRNRTLALLEEETQHAENERLKAEARQQLLRRQLEDFLVPDVSEYVRAKADLRKLQAAVRFTERKVAFAEKSLKTCTTERIQQPLQAAGHNRQENPTKLPRIPQQHF